MLQKIDPHLNLDVQLITGNPPPRDDDTLSHGNQDIETAFLANCRQVKQELNKITLAKDQAKKIKNTDHGAN